MNEKISVEIILGVNIKTTFRLLRKRMRHVSYFSLTRKLIPFIKVKIRTNGNK